MEHTATPWKYDEDSRWPNYLMGHEANPSNGWISRVARIEYLSKVDAEFIVRACNTHDELVEVLKGARLAITDPNLGPSRNGPALYIIEQAIAKAEAND